MCGRLYHVHVKSLGCDDDLGILLDNVPVFRRHVMTYLSVLVSKMFSQMVPQNKCGETEEEQTWLNVFKRRVTISKVPLATISAAAEVEWWARSQG